MQIFNELITHTGVLWGENDEDEFAFNVPDGYEYESFDLDVLNGILENVSRVVQNDCVESLYSGPIAHTGFQRLT